jgi:hypothetical protein
MHAAVHNKAIEQRVSTVKGPFYIGFLCLKMMCLWGPKSQIRMRIGLLYQRVGGFCSTLFRASQADYIGLSFCYIGWIFMTLGEPFFLLFFLLFNVMIGDEYF